MGSDLRVEYEELIEGELGRCSFCGFCEYVCPTYKISKNRIYSPRGRINLIRNYMLEKWLNNTIVESIYSCLLCKACEYECPVKINIVDIIIRFRNILIRS